MKIYTLDDIRALSPCFDPTRYVSEGWTGTLDDILAMEAIPEHEKQWIKSKLEENS